MCEEQGEKSNEGENGDDFDDDSEQQIFEHLHCANSMLWTSLPWAKYYDYLHFTDDKMSSNLPKFAQLLSVKSGDLHLCQSGLKGCIPNPSPLHRAFIATAP